MAKQKIDQFANKAYQRVTMSAANTLTFEEVNFAAGIFQRIALVIHRVIFQPGNALWNSLVASTDVAQVALTVSNGITDIAMTHAEIIARMEWVGYANGTPASGAVVRGDHLIDFSAFPGGGMIVPASPLYVAMATSGMGAAMNCDVEIDFTFTELADADYIELIQSRVKANL